MIKIGMRGAGDGDGDGDLRVQDIRGCAKGQEHEDGVEEITAEAFVPFGEQG